MSPRETRPPLPRAGAEPDTRQRVAPGRLRTFSVTFQDPEFDESPHQQQMVRALGTEHRAIRCGAADIAQVFPAVIRHTEQPVLRTAPALGNGPK